MGDMKAKRRGGAFLPRKLDVDRTGRRRLLLVNPVLRWIAVVGVILAMTGCKSGVTPQSTTTAQPGTSDAKPVVAGQRSADELVPV